MKGLGIENILQCPILRLFLGTLADCSKSPVEIDAPRIEDSSDDIVNGSERSLATFNLKKVQKVRNSECWGGSVLEKVSLCLVKPVLRIFHLS